MQILEFPDKSVTYATFINDLATTVVRMMSESSKDPDMISQRQAFAMFGRANVERWRKQGKIEPCKRPGKIEYRTADLRALQRIQQDYY